MQSNGEVDIESERGEWSTDNLQDSGDQKQDRKDVRANYIQPTVEDVEDEPSVDEPSVDEAAAKSHSIDAPWLLEPYDWLESDSGPSGVFYGCSHHYAPDEIRAKANYVQPMVEDVEDEPSMGEAPAESHSTDAPWLLEPQDWLESDSGPSRDTPDGNCTLAPHDPPDQEDSVDSGWGFSDFMRAAEATGHFVRENGGEFGRDLQNLAKEGFRVESDAFQPFASKWGPLILPSVVKVVRGDRI